MRRVTVALVAVGLALGVVLLWPRSTAEEVPDVETAATSTTTTRPTTTTSTSVLTTGTTADDSHVVTSVEEAEEILRDLWFGWFEGIYNQDEDRIREVVVLEETVETAKESFGVEFVRAPQPDDLNFNDTEILRSDEDCLAVWNVLALSGFRDGTADGVKILRWVSGDWLLLRVWSYRDDLWEADCESLLALP